MRNRKVLPPFRQGPWNRLRRATGAAAPPGGQGATRSEQPWGPHITAKDFRTWHGTVQALELTRLACSGNQLPDGYNAKAVLKEVARQLGNTPAVCRKSYIHPAVMSLGTELAEKISVTADFWETLEGGKATRGLRTAEARLLAFLKAQQRQAARRKASAPATRAHQMAKKAGPRGARPAVKAGTPKDAASAGGRRRAASAAAPQDALAA